MSKGRKTKSKKSGRTMSVIALIIGILGCAIGGYSFYILQTNVSPTLNDIEETYITGIWYAYHDPSYTLTPTLTQIPEINQEITIKTGESIYILFTCNLFLADSTSATFWVYIDGASSPHGYGNYDFSGGAGSIRFSVSVQHQISDLSAGNHTISIYASKSGGSSWVVYSKLSIQSYQP